MGKTTTIPAAASRIAFFALLMITMFAAVLHIGGNEAQAASASVAWSAPTTNTDGTAISNLAGYNLYVGSASRSYQQKINVGNATSYNVANLNDGSTYYFAVTAYNSAGAESAYSTEASKAFPATTTTHTITATAYAGGTITPLNNTRVSTATSGTTVIKNVTVTHAASQGFTIAPSTGYKIADVKVDGVSVGAVASYTFSNVTANHTIAATFAAATTASYTISATAGTGGSITPAGTSTVTSGGSKTYTIAAATGYRIADVKVNGASVGAIATYTFTNVTANKTIAASFASTATTASYTISATAGTGGSITPAGTSTVTSGGSKSYSIAAATGYRIADVKVNGVSVGAVSTYTFTNVTANKTIAASFAAATTTVAPKLVYAANAGGAQYTDASGVVYRADAYYTGGNAGTTGVAINNTSDDLLYQAERWGASTYNIPLANGNYNLTLKFSENYWSATGKRVFDVAVNGVTRIYNLDIFAKAGKNTAYDVVLPVTVSNGTLNIRFINKIDNAKISAFKIYTR